MTKKVILLLALVGVLHASATAFALTGALGNADRIALREGYSQYEGKIDLRDGTGTVTFYYWGGTRCEIGKTMSIGLARRFCGNGALPAGMKEQGGRAAG